MNSICIRKGYTYTTYTTSYTSYTLYTYDHILLYIIHTISYIHTLYILLHPVSTPYLLRSSKHVATSFTSVPLVGTAPPPRISLFLYPHSVQEKAIIMTSLKWGMSVRAVSDSPICAQLGQ